MASSKPTVTKVRRTECHDEQAGRLIKDPYRWMEEDTPELRMWVNEQHEQTKAQLVAQPARERIRRRLETLTQTSALGGVIKAGRWYFFRQRLNGQELSVLYCLDERNGTTRLLLDPNELSSDRSITLADVYPSPDGSMIAYRLSRSGRSGMDLYIMEVASKEVLPDMIPADVNPVAHAWHTNNRVAWLSDSSGFYYTRCPAATPRFEQKLYFHQLGHDWRNDVIVFGESLEREQTPYPIVSSDGQYLAVVVQDLSGTAPRSELYVLDRDDPQRGFVPIALGTDAFINAAFHRDRLYIRTNHQAPLGKLTAVKLSDFAVATVMPEGSHPIRTWIAVADYLFVETIEDVSSRLRVFDLEGNLVKQIELPGIGNINGFSAEPESDELLFSFSSFLMPRAVYRIGLRTLTYKLHHKDELAFDPEQFEVEQVWFESRDNARIPMFLVHRKGIERSSSNPAMVHGYGGFGVSLLPKFTAHVIPFLERGGVYAVVNARGGGEFGEAWHRSGMRENKQNVFDDLIAAGEWLIAQRYTSASKLGCFGWSNGGLLVNAVAAQRPDLWKAVAAGAAVTDMTRYHLAHGGKHWVAEYGSPEDPDDLNFLMQYSPYHNLPEKIEAPALLSIVPGNDDRVAPWHSYKMHAAWLASNVSNNPILLLGEDEAGHRGNPSASKTIDRYADIWTFFFWQLRIDD